MFPSAAVCNIFVLFLNQERVYDFVKYWYGLNAHFIFSIWVHMSRTWSQLVVLGHLIDRSEVLNQNWLLLALLWVLCRRGLCFVLPMPLCHSPYTPALHDGLKFPGNCEPKSVLPHLHHFWQVFCPRTRKITNRGAGAWLSKGAYHANIRIWGEISSTHLKGFVSITLALGWRGRAETSGFLELIGQPV